MPHQCMQHCGGGVAATAAAAVESKLRVKQFCG